MRVGRVISALDVHINIIATSINIKQRETYIRSRRGKRLINGVVFDVHQNLMFGMRSIIDAGRNSIIEYGELVDGFKRFG